MPALEGWHLKPLYKSSESKAPVRYNLDYMTPDHLVNIFGGCHYNPGLYPFLVWWGGPARETGDPLGRRGQAREDEGKKIFKFFSLT